MKTLQQPHPSIERLILGFVLAPLVPAVLLGLFVATLTHLWMGAAVSLFALVYRAYPAALVLGVPTYFILQKYLRPKLVTLALAGGFVAALPFVLEVMLRESGGSITIGSCEAVIEGVRTWCGYQEELPFLATCFVLGAIGGVVFWLCTMWRNPAMVRAPDETGSTSASAPGV